VGECFLWYRLTWVPSRTKGHKMVVVVVVNASVMLTGK